MDISDFNRKLAMFIADARALEKTDQRRANAMWLKICEFAIEYSKQKNVDRTLRLKIWSQVDTIIKKVKGEELISTEPPSSQSTSKKESAIPFEVDFGVDFPSVPKEDGSSENDKVPFQSPEPPKLASSEVDEDKLLFQDAISDNFAEEKPKEQVNDFFERIKKMEDELRKMPDIFKEIRPSEYTPNKSIIPSSAPPPRVSAEGSTKSITLIERDSSLSIEPVENPDTIDPYKGTKDRGEITDPFGPEAHLKEEMEGNQQADNESRLFCYACGAPIRDKDKICKKCGAEL